MDIWVQGYMAYSKQKFCYCAGTYGGYRKVDIGDFEKKYYLFARGELGGYIEPRTGSTQKFIVFRK